MPHALNVGFSILHPTLNETELVPSHSQFKPTSKALTQREFTHHTHAVTRTSQNAEMLPLRRTKCFRGKVPILPIQ